MELSEMTRRVNPRRGLQALVLEHYAEVRAARQHLWSWAEIADALGVAGQGAHLCRAYLRVDRQVEAGRLKVPAPAKAAGAPAARVAHNPGLIQQAKPAAAEPFDFEKYNIMKKE